MPTLAKFVPELAGIGGERRYLVLAVDPAELRPAGGYTGTVGTVAIANGRIFERTFGDVYRYDTKPDLPFVEPPLALQNHLLGDASWQIADGAWSPDFPTAAQDTLRLYELESGDTNIDGVIVVTTFAIDRLLEAVGPVPVPDYGVTVNPGQTTTLALAMTRGVTTPETDRKQFLDELAGTLLGRLASISPIDAPKLKTAFDEISSRRDMMVWVKDPAQEAWFASSPLGGLVGQQPGDYVFVVEANVEPSSKYNLAVARGDNIGVTLDEAGTATDSLTLNWRNMADSPGAAFEQIRSYSTNTAGFYGAYVRLLTPGSSELQSVSSISSDIDSAEETSTTAGRNVFGNYLLMPPGASDLTYQWTVPGAATSSDGLWTYELTVQRQPGISDFPVAIDVTLPSGATDVTTSAGTISDNTISFDTRLARDVLLQVRYRLP